MATATLAPSPAAVDELAAEYLELKEKVLRAQLQLRNLQEPLDRRADELRDLVRDYGSAHAEKARLLHGVNFEILASFGQSVVIDSAAVDVFRLALVECQQTRVLNKIFDKATRWTLSPKAAGIVRDVKLSPKLLGLFARCQVTKEKTPALTVRAKNS